MRPGRSGLHGSVAVIGLVYLLALAFAPSPGVSAEPNTPENGMTAGHTPAVETTATPTRASCPHARHVPVSAAVRRSIGAETAQIAPERWKGARPSVGARHLTVF